MGDVASGDLLWAEQQFGHVELGDVRRHTRLKRMAAAACARPSGKVAAVFQEDREQQAAYDFVESPLVEVQEIVTGVAITTAKRSAEQPFVYVAVDGTSVTVVDNDGELDFGRIGADKKGARGLKVIDALAVDPQGIPVGLLSLTWWARSEQRSPPRDSAERAARPLKEKETRYWVQTVEAAAAALDEQGGRGWFRSIARRTVATSCWRSCGPSTCGRCAAAPTAPSSWKTATQITCVRSYRANR